MILFKLGELCRLISGQHIEASAYNTEARGIGYLTGPSDFGIETPTISKWTEYPKVTASQGDILVTVKGSGVGKTNLLDQDDVAISRQLMAVRVTGADRQYIRLFLQFKFEHLQDISTGAAIPGVSRDQILNLDVPLPPLPEQQRIVAILDEAFAAIATAQANAEKNLQNAQELFVRGLEGTIDQALRSSPIVPISALATDITDGDHMPPPKSESGIPFVTISNIDKATNKLDFGNTFLVSEEYFGKLKHNRKPQNGDVLFTVTGSFGIPVVVGDDRQFCFQRHIALIRPNEETDTKWLFYLLLSPQVFRQAADKSTGTAQKTVD